MKRSEESVLADTIKIFRHLRSNDFCDRSSLCSIFDISVKTLERRINEIRENQKDYYVISDKKRGYKIIPRTTIKNHKQNIDVAPKASGIFTNIYDEKFNTKVKQIDEAIRRKKWVTLFDYTAATGKPKRNMEVFPVAHNVLDDDSLVLAVADISDKTPKTYKLSRCSSVKLKDKKGEYEFDKNNIFSDDFGMIFFKGESVYRVDLLLTSYSAAMIARDFNHFKERITELGAKSKIKKYFNGKDYLYDYKLSLSVCEVGPVGRITCGMLDHIIVQSDSAKFMENLRGYVRETVYNAFETNLLS
jgi:hypothetical protein